MIGASEGTGPSTPQLQTDAAALPEAEAPSPHLVATQLKNLQDLVCREETMRQFRSMVIVSFTCIITGATVGIVGCVLGSSATSEGTFLFRTWSSTSYVCGCAGLMVLGTCPVEEIDKTSVAGLNARQRVGLGAGWALVNFMFAVNYPPHAHVLGVIAGSSLAVTAFRPEFGKSTCGEPCQFKAGGFMMVWFALFLFSHGLMHMWVGGVDFTDPIMTLAIPAEWHLVVAAVNLLGAVVLVLMWLWRYSRSSGKNVDDRDAEPLSLAEALSMFLGPLCLGDIIVGSLGHQHQLHSWISVALLVRGGSMALVSFFLWVLGYQWVYTGLMRAFTKKPTDAQRDREFIASLLDSKVVCRGQVWWTERVEPDLEQEPAKCLPMDEEDGEQSPHPQLSTWRKGRIHSLDLENDKFVVEVFPDGVDEDWIAENAPECAQASQNRRTSQRTRRSSIFRPRNGGGGTNVHPESTMQPLPTRMRAAPWQDLMSYATENLRCVEWADVTQDFLMGSGQTGAKQPLHQAKQEFAKSRPTRQGETIDFFVSHSWNDEGGDKFSALEGIAGGFLNKNGRLPTFWIDRCCIDRRISLDGLRMLPVHVMSCKKVAVLFGPTYNGRLLCVWELFTLLALSKWTHASEKLCLVPLGGLAATSESETGSPCKSSRDSTCPTLDALPRLKEAIAAGFKDFSLKVVSCCDPNEEHRLRQVIQNAGEARFCARIKVLADALGTSLEENVVDFSKKASRTPSLRRLIGKGRSSKTVSTVATLDHHDHTPQSAASDTLGGSPKSDHELKPAREQSAVGDLVATGVHEVQGSPHACELDRLEDFSKKPPPLPAARAEQEPQEPPAVQPARVTSEVTTSAVGDENQQVSALTCTADQVFTNFADSPQKTICQSDAGVNDPHLHVEVDSHAYCCAPVPIGCQERMSGSGERSLATSLRICQAQSNKAVPS